MLEIDLLPIHVPGRARFDLPVGYRFVGESSRHQYMGAADEEKKAPIKKVDQQLSELTCDCQQCIGAIKNLFPTLFGHLLAILLAQTSASFLASHQGCLAYEQLRPRAPSMHCWQSQLLIAET